jgi:succinyl-CoA synthetase beta subunit
MAALNEKPVNFPVIVRFAGTNADEGRKILDHPLLKQADSINEAAGICIDIAGKAD